METTENNQQQMPKKKSTISAGWIAAMVIFAILGGIRAYTSYLNKQTQTALEEIMEHNMETHGTPFVLSDGTTLPAPSSTSSKETYSKDGISFTYPSKYKVEYEKDDEGLNNISCEIKGSDISLMQICYYSVPAFSNLGSDDIEEVCKEALKETAGSFDSQFGYRDVHTEPITKTELSGVNAWQSKFTAKVLTTLCSGIAYITIKNDVYVMVIIQAEKKSYEEELLEIVNSLNF